jgi:hypothetical protein
MPLERDTIAKMFEEEEIRLYQSRNEAVASESKSRIKSFITSRLFGLAFGVRESDYLDMEALRFEVFRLRVSKALHEAGEEPLPLLPYRHREKS